MVLPTLENRLRRAQTTGEARIWLLGGGQPVTSSIAMRQRSFSAMRALYQFMASEVTRLSVR